MSRLHSLKVLDTLPESEFDGLVATAADLLEAPIVLVSLVDKHRQWFKAKVGLDICETTRDAAFCAHAILQDEPLIVPDATLDERFSDNPLVTGEFHLRFYAGAPIVVDGMPLGTLCCLDLVPRQFSARQIRGLVGLANQAAALLSARLLENRLVESEERFFAFLDHAPTATFLKDAEGILRYANPAFEVMTGRKADSLIGLSDKDWLPEEMASEFRRQDLEIVTRGSTLEVDQTVLYEDGSERVWQILKFPVPSEQGAWVGGIALDITQARLSDAREREQAIELERRNQRLMESSQQLQEALETARIAVETSKYAASRFQHLFGGLPVPCYSFDSEGTVHEWNKAAEELWGIPAHMAIQQSVVGTAVSQDNRAIFENLIERVFSGETVSGVELTETLRDGKVCNLLSSTIPLRDFNGTVVGALSANVDVTESRVATAQLLNTKNSLAQAQAIASVGSFEFDLDKAETRWSDEMFRIFGYSPADPIPSFEEMLARTDANDVDMVRSHVEESLGAWIDTEFVQRLCLPSGEARVVRALIHADMESRRIVGTVQDITERRKMEAALAESESRFRTAIQSMHEGLSVQSRDGRIILFNDRACEILGLTSDQMAGRTSIDPRWRAVHEDGSPWPGETHPAMIALKEGIDQNGQVMGIHKPSGELTWLSVNAVPLFQEGDPAPYRVVVTISDITERKMFESQIASQLEQIQKYAVELEEQKGALEAANTKLLALSLTDGLTGLHNKRSLEERLVAEISLAARSGTPLSVAMIDVDHFKAFNDEFGHPAGDKVLIEVAKILGKSARVSDIVARYGGEEFLVIMPGVNRLTSIKVAERTRKAIADHGWDERPITASFGVATLSVGASREEFLKQADEALYMSKNSGRNQVTHFFSHATEAVKNDEVILGENI